MKTRWSFGDWLMVVLMAALLAVAVMKVREPSDWESFKSAHDCKPVAEIASNMGMAANGQGVFMPGQTGWQCSDGKTYFR